MFFKSWILRRQLRNRTKDLLRSRNVSWYSVFFFGDTPAAGCPFCGEVVKQIAVEKDVASPQGEVFQQTVKMGYCCLRCGVTAPNDTAPLPMWKEIGVLLASLDQERGVTLPPIAV